MPEDMDELVDHLRGCGMADSDTVIACTRAEVDEVRADIGVEKLPAHYEQFLLRMGRRAGELLRGTDFFYPAILGLSADGREFLEENGVAHLLAPGSIIIGMHQGYQLYWMDPGEPSGQVHFYTENSDDIAESWPSLLEFLVAEAAEERRARGR